MIALKLMNVENEDVVCRLFPHTLKGKATKIFFNLAPRSITSWKQFEAFMEQFSDEETSGILFLGILGLRMNEKEKVKDFNQIFITLLNRVLIIPAEVVQIEYYTTALLPNIAMFVKNQEKLTPVDNFGEDIKVEKDLEAISSYLGD